MSREMKDSGLPWVKEIPSEYEIREVKNIFSIGRGRVIAKTEIESANDGTLYPVYSSQTAIDGCMGYISTYDYEQDGLTWTTDGANAGTVFLRSGKFNCTNVCGVLTAKDNNSYYLPYFAYSVNLSAMNSRRSDILGHKVMSNEMAHFKAIFPTDYNEQIKIADFLDRKCSAIDTAIEKTKKSIEKLEEYKKAVITKAVTKGIDPNAKMKDSGVEWIGEIPEGWEVIKLKYLLKDSMKYGATETGVEYSKELPRYIRITDISSDNKLKDSGKLSLTEQQAEKYLLKADTILFARSGASVGKTFYYKPEYGRAAFAGYMISAIPNKDKMLAAWLYYYTLSFSYTDWVKRSFFQATIQNIGADKYSNLLIPLPYTNEQIEIVKYLDERCIMFDTIIKKKKKAIEKWEEYKKSLIYYAVTGKIDCRNEVLA